MTQLVTTFLLAYTVAIGSAYWFENTQLPGSIVAMSVIGTLFALGLSIQLKKRRLLLISCILLGINVAVLTQQLHRRVQSSNEISHYATKKFIRVEGIISAEPDRRPMQTKYTIQTTAIVNEAGEILSAVQGKILITDRRQWPEYQIDDRVVVSGILETPGLIDNTFYYDRYLHRYSIYAVMYSASLEKIAEHASWQSYAWKPLLHLKQLFEAQINRMFAEPHASFMAGLLTGSRRGIPEDLQEHFAITGLTHIIAISGYNITIIITVLSTLCWWLPRRSKFITTMVGIICFTLFVGASAAVVRAAIMGSLGLLAIYTNKKHTARLGVLWTFFFMTLWNPRYVWYDAGFQLSFAAVLGLIEVYPILETACKKVPAAGGLKEAFLLTMSAQISTLPLLLLLFSRLSLVAPLSNVLVAPFIPAAMLFGFIGVVLSTIWFPLGQAVGGIAWLCLETIIHIARWCSLLPYASIETVPKEVISYMLYYLGIICICVWWNKKPTTDTHTAFALSSHR